MSELPEIENDLQQCLTVLHAGGLILYPTDTIWGIGCDATNESAVKKIFELKKRPDSKALIVLVAEPKDILRYTSQPDLSVIDHLKTKQKPTTVIYEGAIGFAPNLIAGDGSVAIRITADTFCRHLIKRFRKPVVSTSANVSAEQAPANYSLIDPEIKKGVDYIVKYRQHENQSAQPSSVIKWVNGREVIVRP
jgi:L-threonylcarbamoyladenylate synthase